MKIENPVYVSIDGYPSLEVEIDGQIACIPLEQKPTLYKAGILFVGLPPGSVPPIEFNGTLLQQSVQSPELMKLFDEFGTAVKEGRFTPDRVYGST